jgi:hypothetical protein
MLMAVGDGLDEDLMKSEFLSLVLVASLRSWWNARPPCRHLSDRHAKKIAKFAFVDAGSVKQYVRTYGVERQQTQY